MKDRPILFSGAMVNAILEGRKTQTRRVVKGIPEDWFLDWWDPTSTPLTISVTDGGDSKEQIKCPYGKPGDRLWVREKFLVELPGDYRYDAEGIPPGEYPAHLQKESIVHYAATNTLKTLGAWKPSIHMPRWASRITLEIVSVRVERLNDISEEDAVAEGIEVQGRYAWMTYQPKGYSAIGPYRALWESIHGPGSWEANPWVWVVEFKVVES